MTTARRYEESRRIVEEEKKRRGGCASCGEMKDTMIFAKDEGYPDKYMISQLMGLAIAHSRLIEALKHTTMYCQSCYGKEIGWKGSRYKPFEPYEECSNHNCKKKVRVTIGGKGYCKQHADRARQLHGDDE